mmetsp:Transcript_7345/g.16842  ORF Transcript_7345/g.16842 Transcript_7345/m.16842 type:complete len:235 (-) Transcript_7345:68-772(-)
MSSDVRIRCHVKESLHRDVNGDVAGRHDGDRRGQPVVVGGRVCAGDGRGPDHPVVAHGSPQVEHHLGGEARRGLGEVDDGEGDHARRGRGLEHVDAHLHLPRLVPVVAELRHAAATLERHHPRLPGIVGPVVRVPEHLLSQKPVLRLRPRRDPHLLKVHHFAVAEIKHWRLLAVDLHQGVIRHLSGSEVVAAVAAPPCCLNRDLHRVRVRLALHALPKDGPEPKVPPCVLALRS